MNVIINDGNVLRSLNGDDANKEIQALCSRIQARTNMRFEKFANAKTPEEKYACFKDLVDHDEADPDHVTEEQWKMIVEYTDSLG